MELQTETLLSSQPKLESQDSTALTEEQQKALDKHKVYEVYAERKLAGFVIILLKRLVCLINYQVEARLQNEVYMRDHPEVSVMLESFVR